MARFFVSADNIRGGAVCLKGADTEHIKVLRIRTGEEFTACDGQGTDYICRLMRCGAGSAEAEIVERKPSAGEPSVDCTVYAAFPKADKAETIVQKAVELGAARIVFFPSARCVSRPDKAGMDNKLVRWRKISEEAAKQSGRGVIPPVGVLPSYSDMLESARKAGLPLFFYEGGGDSGIKNALERAADLGTVALVTGPEGGFEPDEVEAAREKGLRITGLGSRILRCETAPACALAAVMLFTGNL